MFNMFGNILKNTASKPSTRLYPKERRKPFSNTRGHIGIDIDQCIFCGICSKKCPSNAIVVDRKTATWEIDYFKCLICGACADACPKKCVQTVEEYLTSAYVKKKGTFIQAAKPAEQKAPAVQEKAAAETQVQKTEANKGQKAEADRTEDKVLASKGEG